MELFCKGVQRRKCFKLLTIGVTLIGLGILIIILNPLQLVVDHMLTVYDGSFLFGLWQKPPLEVFISVYVFNITNLNRFLNGQDAKLKLQEVGPYVYQEFLENTNATFNKNNTLTYRPKRRVEFVRDKSIGDPKIDYINVPNIPYMGVTTAASKLSKFAALGVLAIMKTLKSQVVLNITAHDYLWGYNDPLVKIASSILPGIIHFKTFGLLDRMFDEGDNLVTMALPDKNNKQKKTYINEWKNKKSFPSEEEEEPYEPVVRDFSITSWNGKSGLSYWGHKEENYGSTGNSDCNTLRGTYDGTLFPRNITKGEIFRIYRKPFCRTLPIVFSHEGSIDGIDAYFFKLADNAFDSNMNDTESSCFCNDNVCLKKGLGNITPCYYNIPAAVSFPHFFNADKSLLDGVDGLHPNEEKHGTEIVLQPQLGAPMRVHSRLQINLLMGEVAFNPSMSPFRDTVLPIIWLEIAVDRLPTSLKILLQLLFNICPYIQIGLTYLAILSGVSLIGVSLLVILCIPKPPTEFNPKDVRYSAIHIFPYAIRKEFEKYGDEECLAQNMNTIDDRNSIKSLP